MTIKRIWKICIVCGEYKKHHAHGKCHRCYAKEPGRARKPKARRPTNTKSPPIYLGCEIAEKVLSKVFNDVKVMPYGNPGFDLICNKGKKIDVKGACKGKNRNRWLFNIKKNTIADFFLCVAFDNRKSLVPLHLWLLPSNEVKDKKGASISPGTIHKWDKFKLDISKTLQCCNQMKE